MSRILRFSLFLWMVVIAIMLVALPGCATFETNVAPKIAKAVTAYCAQPVDERLALRARVNGLIAPNSVAVTCQGDTP